MIEIKPPDIDVEKLKPLGCLVAFAAVVSLTITLVAVLVHLF